MTALVRVHQQLFPIDDAVVPVLESSILDAVHTGGAFVGIPTGAGVVRVLVTPATAVSVEPAPRAVTPGVETAAFPDLSFYDFE